jgi:tyrosine-protein phosphatase YwqE
VVPINNATLDLNKTEEKLTMPLDLFPGAEVHLKGTKLAIEKNF